MTYVKDYPQPGVDFCTVCRVSFVSWGNGRALHEKNNPTRHPSV